MHTLTSFATSFPGMIAALAAAFGATLGLLRLFRRSGPASPSSLHILLTILCLGYAGTSLCLLLTLAARPAGLADSGDRAGVLRRAIVALQENRHSEAISLANTIILSCSATALDEQSSLERNHEPRPPAGAIASPREVLIPSHSALNDTAAAHWIKAAALEQLGRPREAAQAYRDLAPLSYARLFDPSNDLFWSPSQEAQHALTRLQLASNQ